MARRRDSNAHLPRYVYLIHGSYWYRPPNEKAVRIGAEEHLVWRFMADLSAPQAPPKQGATLKEYFERYKREVIPGLAPNSQANYSHSLAVLEKVFGHMHPDEVKPRDIGAFLDRPKSKIAANRHVAVLSAVYGKMVGRWYVAERNPCIGVERNETHRRTRYITDEEFWAVWQSANPRVRLAMELALLTGQRQGDILSLEFKNVTDEGILFHPAKTAKKVGKKIMVAMSPTLKEVIERARAMTPAIDIGGNVLRTREGVRYTSPGFKAMWQRTMNRALRKRIITERFTFHDIRAKCVSDSASLEAAFERAGHTSMQMTRSTYDRGVRRVTPLK